jgi:hypothetical protein
MNLSHLQTKLIAAARSRPASDAVPFAFEKRIMARLRAQQSLDVCSLWAKALLRASAPCVVLMLLLSAWSLLSPAGGSSSGTDLSQDFENTVLAAVDPEQPAD